MPIRCKSLLCRFSERSGGGYVTSTWEYDVESVQDHVMRVRDVYLSHTMFILVFLGVPAFSFGASMVDSFLGTMGREHELSLVRSEYWEKKKQARGPEEAARLNEEQEEAEKAIEKMDWPRFRRVALWAAPFLLAFALTVGYLPARSIAMQERAARERGVKFDDLRVVGEWAWEAFLRRLRRA